MGSSFSSLLVFSWIEGSFFQTTSFFSFLLSPYFSTSRLPDSFGRAIEVAQRIVHDTDRILLVNGMMTSSIVMGYIPLSWPFVVRQAKETWICRWCTCSQRQPSLPTQIPSCLVFCIHAYLFASSYSTSSSSSSSSYLLLLLDSMIISSLVRIVTRR